MIYYFAYGSNMDKEDLDKWCRTRGLPLVKFLSISPAKLNGYALSFNYFSISRNGGAANIMLSSNDCVHGLLVTMEEVDFNTIRVKEGYPRYYDEIYVQVETFDGVLVPNVMTYKVVQHLEKPEHQLPKRYYLGLIINNAQKYNFPPAYIGYLETIKTKN